LLSNPFDRRVGDILLFPAPLRGKDEHRTMIERFCDWLSNTPFSMTIQTVLWIIPAVQTVHILCVAVVMSSMAMLDLRLMGLVGRRGTISDMVGRFVPWVWRTLVVLATSGAILIIGEPSRELLNPYFQAKMVMLAAVTLITFVVQRQTKKNATYWETRKAAAIATGLASLLLWVGIITAGRWIAYF
jgi:uncharacterized membrane protein SirB2